jgi:hypothetical protein|tara:strand:+ start:5103 stop:5324 length:222 start_codon:yes stop_codon:yes gene_type:complete
MTDKPIITEHDDDAYIRFSTEDGRLDMTVMGNPGSETTIAANHCITIFSEFLERMGLSREDDDLRFMDTEGSA